MDLSIIVPVYNTKSFVKECLESLLSDEDGSLKYEILLIDNGSSDGSRALCEELAKKHKCVEVLNCEKAGAAAVRNFGLRRAKGKYVWFVDSDDYCKKEAMAYRDIIKTDADVVMIMAEKVDEKGCEMTGIGAKLYAIDPENDSEWRRKFVKIGVAPWQIVCKREFLLKNNLFYDEGMIHEDMALLSSFVLYTDKIVLSRKITYCYRQRTGSVLHQEKWSEREFDIFAALELLSRRFEKAKKFNKYKDEIEYFYIWNLLDDAARAFKRFSEARKGYGMIRKTMKKRFPNWRKNKYFLKQPIMVRARCYTAYFGVVW